jgi:hypothetical protein
MLRMLRVFLLFLIRLRGGVEIASMALMLLGTQWYIPFNVIAGAMDIPTDFEGSLLRFSLQKFRPLAPPHSPRNLPLPGHRNGYRVWRRVECQHRRRIFSFSGENRPGFRTWQYLQSRKRCWPLRFSSRFHSHHGHRRGPDQSSVLAPPVPSRFKLES